MEYEVIKDGEKVNANELKQGDLFVDPQSYDNYVYLVGRLITTNKMVAIELELGETTPLERFNHPVYPAKVVQKLKVKIKE